MTTSFDKSNVRQILAECEVALNAVAIKHSCKLQRKSCSYSATELPVAFKLVTTATDSDGNVVTADSESFKALADMYGFKSEDLGREFMSNGTRFRITGLRRRRRKFPICGVRVSDGKGFKFPAEQVKRGLLPKLSSASASTQLGQ